MKNAGLLCPFLTGLRINLATYSVNNIGATEVYVKSVNKVHVHQDVTLQLSYLSFMQESCVQRVNEPMPITFWVVKCSDQIK